MEPAVAIRFWKRPTRPMPPGPRMTAATFMRTMPTTMLTIEAPAMTELVFRMRW